jgi:hypothetical protein
MQLQIDNFDGLGLIDYTPALDADHPAQIVRKLNQATEMKFSLVAEPLSLLAPVSGGRVVVVMANGQYLFTGYIVAAPEFEYLG